MYKPSFNSVLVQIDDDDAKWGSGNDESMLGKSYSKGTAVEFGNLVPDDKYDIETLEDVRPMLDELVGKPVMWNEGAEAGTTWEENGKLYGFIYWWDIRGVKDDTGEK